MGTSSLFKDFIWLIINQSLCQEHRVSSRHRATGLLCCYSVGSADSVHHSPSHYRVNLPHQQTENIHGEFEDELQ